MTDVKDVDNQGHNANKTGKWLEDQVEKTLAKYGIKSVYCRELYTAAAEDIINDSKHGLLVKNVPYTNMFGANAYGEFVLLLKDEAPIRIECRNQDVNGSAQDKLPKLLGDCIAMEERSVIVVLEGNGFTEKARNWFTDAAAAQKTKSIDVRSLLSFKSWAEDKFGAAKTKRVFVVPTTKRTSSGLKTKQHN